MAEFDYDVIVVGAGAGGLVVAGGTAALGLKVALVEKGKLGGESLNYGCVPSKAIIHAANVARDLKKAQKIGIDIQLSHIELKKITDYIHHVQDTVGSADSKEALEKQGIKVIQGFATFVDNHTLDVDGVKTTAKKFCIATGSRPEIPPIEGLKETGFLTNETILSMEKLPESLLVVGGGSTGLEFAQTFSRFGCKVTVLEKLEHLFPNDDPEIGPLMEKLLTDEGIELILGCDIKKFYGKDGKKTSRVKHQGMEKEFAAEDILIAAGRTPNISHLDLKMARVKYDQNGIKVNKRLRTSVSNIWACGDAVGHYQFTHMAAHQAGVVIANMIFRYPRKVNYAFVPWCTFTDPEVANVGMTENMAKEKGIRCETAKFEFKDLDRAVCDDAEVGFLKLLIKKNKIIGAACVGPDAGNIIHELILAASAKLSILDISRAIHIHPTLAQINAKAVSTYLGQKYASQVTKNMAQFMFNFLT